MLSPAAVDLLSRMLATEVTRQVQEGRGDEPMPEEWTELYSLTLPL